MSDRPAALARFVYFLVAGDGDIADLRVMTETEAAAANAGLPEGFPYAWGGKTTIDAVVTACKTHDELVDMLSEVLGAPVSNSGRYIFIDGPGDQPLREYLQRLLSELASLKEAVSTGRS